MKQTVLEKSLDIITFMWFILIPTSAYQLLTHIHDPYKVTENALILILGILCITKNYQDVRKFEGYENGLLKL